jgi:hypothetical protein
MSTENMEAASVLQLRGRDVLQDGQFLPSATHPLSDHLPLGWF